MIKTKLTPVRYPGGKSNALKTLNNYLPEDFTSYREPFFGGGSVGLYLMQFNKDATYWINDLFYPVYCFWKVIYEQPDEMVKYLLARHETYSKPQTGIVGEDSRVKGIPTKAAIAARAMHTFCRSQILIDMEQKDEFHTACHWYILNKTSYSGMAMIGSYAPLAWDQNFTVNCIKNLPKTHDLMRSVKHVRITNLNYAELLKSDGDHDDNTFIFLDPPYKIPHNLYGDKGDIHEKFDHKKFADDVRECKIPWLITYNNDPQIDAWFLGYHKLPWELQYTMKAAKRTSAGNLVSENKAESELEPEVTNKSGKMGKELLVANYPL